MRLIERTSYLNKLRSVEGTPDIKVLTGIRRCGKSKLLESFAADVENNNPLANVIHINFNLDKFDDLRNRKALLQYVSSAHKPNVANYVFIDEVQMCEGFEGAINSLHATEQYDIYITGSNAFLMSSDLATLFTGRTFQIPIYPFSLNEFMRYFELDNDDEAFFRYTFEGGMPGSYVYKTAEDRQVYLQDVSQTLIVRDLREKYHIRNIDSLDSTVDYLIDNISNITSSRKIANYFSSARIKVTDKTISSYLKYLCEAFAFYKVRRYDTKGKRYLSSGDKYYLADHSFKTALLGTRNIDFGRAYENMVAIELLRRGYEIYAGILHNKEVDFVAVKHSEKFYVQVADNIAEKSTLERETSSLLSIRDAYPKLILANTGHPTYTYEGVEIHNLASWLKGE